MAAAAPDTDQRSKRIFVLLLVLLSCGTGCSVFQRTPTASTPRHSPTVAIRIPQPALGNGISGVGLFVEPDDGKLRLTRPIRKAVRSIDLTMYMLTDRTLIHDLEYAASRGTRVRVILERAPYGGDVSSAAINQSAFDQLYAADIPVHWSCRRYALTHQKTMIVDGATAYILTMNYTRAAFIQNREFGVVDRVPADVAEAEAIFSADWNDRAFIPRDPNLLLSPVNSRTRFVALLARARKHVAVYAEEVQDAAIEDALVACAHRGVGVQIITNASTNGTADLARLRSGGVQVRLLTAPYIHAKMVLVDGRWAFIGSENISAASLDKNRELGVLLSDPAALVRLDQTFEHDWALQ